MRNRIAWAFTLKGNLLESDNVIARTDHWGKEVKQERNDTRKWSNRAGVRHADIALCEGASLRPSSSCRTELLAAFTSRGILSQSDKFIARADHRGKEVTQRRTITRMWSARTGIWHGDRAL